MNRQDVINKLWELIDESEAVESLDSGEALDMLGLCLAYLEKEEADGVAS